MSFEPLIGLDGFKVRGSLDVNNVNCLKLNEPLYQLGVILYPTDLFNEKFLIKMRDCVIKQDDTHPVKRWFKWAAAPKPLQKSEQSQTLFLNEMLNSQFNLITDLKVKNKIIELISEIHGKSLLEKMLKSYLYLMIGNVSRSDAYLRRIIQETPISNWKGFRPSGSLFDKITKANLPQIFRKLSKHPSDRRTFELFIRYLQEFFNDPTLTELASSSQGSSLDGKLNLAYVKSIAPQFVELLRLETMNEERRIKELRKENNSTLKDQSYWIWPFLDIDPLVSDALMKELVRLEQDDHLWFIYVMDNEKLMDLYLTKSGKSFLAGRRQFLRGQLKNQDTFMMALYKLIEFGDVDQNLVNEALEFMTHD